MHLGEVFILFKYPVPLFWGFPPVATRTLCTLVVFLPIQPDGQFTQPTQRWWLQQMLSLLLMFHSWKTRKERNTFVSCPPLVSKCCKFLFCLFLFLSPRLTLNSLCSLRWPLNFWFSCLYLPSAGIAPSVYNPGHWTQHCVHASYTTM